ncbi:uncharacterized protein [Miscanthus floridulus]|uniref:uncharacterized protein isoform X2 n=1 Tax=Miscanthus floridulus TaxID=154761 RepID=UPI00345AB8B3
MKNNRRGNQKQRRSCRSIVTLAATTDGWRMCCSGTVVDHVSKKTWILTSATLVRKPDTQFEVYGHDDIKIEVVLHNKQTVQKLFW